MEALDRNSKKARKSAYRHEAWGTFVAQVVYLHLGLAVAFAPCSDGNPSAYPCTVRTLKLIPMSSPIPTDFIAPTVSY